MPTIRSLQHYLYCPRRFALIEIDRQWNDNFFTVNAELKHEKVHSGKHAYSDKNKCVRSDVTVYNDEYDLYGVIDCVEFVRSGADNATVIPFLGYACEVRIIEYKPTAPKGAPREEDVLQVYAQKVCADSVWQCDSKAYIYYADTRRRELLPFDEADVTKKYDRLLKNTLSGMAECVNSRRVPLAETTAKCHGCSFASTCMPKVKTTDIRRLIGEGK